MRTTTARGLAGLMVAAGCLSLAPSARATPMQLTDGASVVDIDPSSQKGVFNWSVTGIGGQNLLPQEWFWYRTSGSQELSIDTMTLTAVAPPDYVFPNVASWTYTSGNLKLDMTAVLVDAAPSSSLSWTVTWRNTSTASGLDLTIFYYTHLQLGTSSDVVDIVLNQAIQHGNGYMASTMVLPYDASLAGFEALPISTTLDTLNDAQQTQFGALSHATGAVSSAFEWQVRLSKKGTQGDTYQMSLFQQLDAEVPEPSTALLGLGALTGMFLLRRRIHQR